MASVVQFIHGHANAGFQNQILRIGIVQAKTSPVELRGVSHRGARIGVILEILTCAEDDHKFAFFKEVRDG